MYRHILVPIDGSEPARRGLDTAIDLAKTLGASLRVVNVANELVVDLTPFASGTLYQQVADSIRDSGKELLRRAETRVRAAGLECDTALVETLGGQPAVGIIEQAREWPADLIVMGTHGRRGLSRLALGSDAEEVLRTAPVPVLLVRDTSKQETSHESR